MGRTFLLLMVPTPLALKTTQMNHKLNQQRVEALCQIHYQLKQIVCHYHHSLEQAL